MLKVDKVIVTVILNKNSAIDMELPAFLPLSELTGKILESLKILAPSEFEGTADIDLVHNGTVLDSRGTLASIGIWDGSILQISRR